MTDWPQLPTPTCHFVAQLQSPPMLMPLSDYELLVVEGPDAEKFLQGQCTCDFARTAKGDWISGAHCNPKGRMNSSFYAARLGDQAFGLRVHRSISDSARAAFHKYIVFSKAEIRVQPALMVGLLLAPEATALPATDVSLPEPGQCAPAGEGNLLLRHEDNRVELWITADVPTWFSDLTSACTSGSTGCWQQLDTAAGRTEVRAESAEQLIPQEINLQLTDGVSFTKGCYTGQEIVARMHYRAKLKKHLYRASVEAPGLESAFNTDITDDQGQSYGKLISAVATGDNQWELLVLVQDAAQEKLDLGIGPSSQPKLQWLPLPYAIPNE